MDGTADKGARSERADSVRTSAVGRDAVPRIPGGDEERIPVLEVGTGVGYLRYAVLPIEPARACRLTGRGSPGEEERGSKGGRRVGAGRLVPAAGGGSVGSVFFDCGEESIIMLREPCQEGHRWWRRRK